MCVCVCVYIYIYIYINLHIFEQQSALRGELPGINMSRMPASECALTFRLLMSYIYIYIYICIYGAPILDVSRSHTTTQHSR